MQIETANACACGMRGWLFSIVRIGIVVASVQLYGAETPAPRAKPAGTVPGRAYFDDPKIRTVQFEIAEAALKSLAGAPRTYVSGTVREGDRTLTNVAIRLKGNGSFRAVDEKASFTVKFDGFVPGQNFHGLTKVMFNNSVQDPTYVAELLATGLFRDAGLPAARVTHARVQLNGRDLGLYVVIEGMNKGFLKQHFQDATGNLYEGYLQDIDTALDQDGGEDTSQADVRALWAACRITDPVERWKSVSQRLDVDRFTSFVAMEILAGHWDGYAIHTNNFRLYHDPRSGKMMFITHGLDWAFRRPNISIRPPLKSIVGRAVFQTAAGQELFRERIGSLFTNVYRVTVLTRRLDEALGRIRAAGLDAAVLARIERSAAVLRDRIELRGRRVGEQLAGIPPQPPRFDARGAAPLSGWRDESDRGEPLMDQPRHEERGTLHIRAEGGRCRASWRAQVYLAQGRYRVECMACTQGLAGGSAGVRISGGRRETGVSGTTPWRRLTNDFEVVDEGMDVEIVCDFYGTAGEVWFDLNSFQVQRL